jgi:fatty-acid desaturase
LAFCIESACVKIIGNVVSSVVVVVVVVGGVGVGAGVLRIQTHRPFYTRKLLKSQNKNFVSTVSRKTTCHFTFSFVIGHATTRL